MQISDDVTREDMADIRKFRTWKFSRVKAVLARLGFHIKVSYFVQCLCFQRLFPLPSQNITNNTKMYCQQACVSYSTYCGGVSGCDSNCYLQFFMVTWYHLILHFEYQYFSVLSFYFQV
jgi:hypothetical protein